MVYFAGVEAVRLQLARRTLRAYPLLRGRWRIASLILTGSLTRWEAVPELVAPRIPEGEVMRARHGLLIRLRRDETCVALYLFGDYEENQTRFLRRLVRPGEIVFDVGTNFGWYSVLLAALVGAEGQVHAFEPVPELAALAAETVRLNGSEAVVRLNAIGLSSASGPFTVHTFSGLPDAHASCSDLGRTDATPHACEAATLDRYVTERRLSSVAFAKIDVEGHELEVLRGGGQTLARPDAPVLAFELNRACLAHHGTEPASVLRLLREYGYTDFWMLEPKGGARPTTEGPSGPTADYLAGKASSSPRIEEALRSMPRLLGA